MTPFKTRNYKFALIILSALVVYSVGMFLSFDVSAEPKKTLNYKIPTENAKVSVNTANASNTVEGEVMTMRVYQDDLLIVLTEWPVTIRITDDTEFKSKEGLTISKLSAKDILLGKGVKIVKAINASGEVVAKEIEVLRYKELLNLKSLQSAKTQQYRLKAKDAIPVMKKNKR